MKCDISYKISLNEMLRYCLDRLPHHIKVRLLDYLEKNPYKDVNEIRLHKNSYIMLIADSKNIKTDIYLTDKDIEQTYNQLCDMSLYAHIDTIKDGYISVGNGIRAGICGKAHLENNQICGISELSSINLRIPNHIYNSSSYLFNLLKEKDFDTSVILYSPPGVGKTTILRDLVYKISNNTHIRYAIIDSKNEITSCLNDLENADVYISYPKGLAIELATKSMSSQLIICDEISSYEESAEILKAVNSGVNLIATTHASSFEELCTRVILKDLITNNAFDFALGVAREYGKKQYQFTLNKFNEDNR